MEAKNSIKNSKIQPEQYSSVYDYLEATGILEYGTNKAIKEAKSLYWKSYRKRYKKEQFETSNKSLSISFKLDEYHRLKSEAQNQKLPISRYLKQQLSQKGSSTELERLLFELICDLEEEELSQDLIIERLDLCLNTLNS